MKDMTRVLALALFGLALLAGGCAQDVGDIDRTQANKLRKSDLDGVWFMMETVAHVPSTTLATFEGETSKMEKIVWRIEENYLLAFRAYPRVPGVDDVDGNYDYADDAYTENPVAAFPIISHFDVVREYNPQTGEQSNVIVENSWDKQWFEREFMRVDWSRNVVTNFDFVSDWFWSPVQGAYVQDVERDEPRSLYYERDEADNLVYFDLPRHVLLEPDFWGCIFSTWYYWGTEDCAPAQVEIVTAFSRTDKRRDYEPLPYSDQEMSRFGYFRSERDIFDPQRGVTDSNRLRLINRHNIWRESYRKDDSGALAVDDAGALIPIPVEDREHRTVPYYLNTTFPQDPLLREAALDTMTQWDDFGREAIALAQGKDVSAISRPAYVLCQNPVAEGDDPACGEPGFSPRPGDMRYSTLHWVESEQLQGPLGYGPAATDPETGEILSGRAYVYGSSLSTYASYGVDVLRFINGDLDPEVLKNAEHIRAGLRARRDGMNPTNERIAPELRDIPVDSKRLRDPRRMGLRAERREALRHFDRDAIQNRLKTAREAGVSPGVLSGEEFDKALASRMRVPLAEMTPEQLQGFDPLSWFNPTAIKEVRKRRMRAAARSVDYPEMLDPNVIGIARDFEGRTDYEQIWRELRAELFRATALHEVGHTVGLRHNFQGTYDSLNFHDTYWELKRDTLKEPANMAEMIELTRPTEAQHDGRMLDHAYSSIMDYGLTFHSDLQGLGKYDRAALIYGYTGGYTRDASGDCAGPDSRETPDGCLTRKMGFVEVFNKRESELGGAAEILTDTDQFGFRYDDPTSPIVPYLERWHYTTFMRSFPALDDAFDRSMMRIDEVVEARGTEDAPVRVPYLFCSDEWVGALLSCQVFDAGADPYEMTRNIVQRYRTYYYFDNFKRDRLGWDAFSAFYFNYFYTFLPISDYFQNWYLAPEGQDEIFDNYFWMAINMGFNLMVEAIATPPYGTFCTGQSGRLYHLSDEPGQNPDATSEYQLTVNCDRDAPFFEVLQGEGRRRFTAFDVDSGYYFAEFPLEAGHYWTTLASFWAMIDPEAFVLGASADVGTFAISYYDFFDSEVEEIVRAVISEDYASYSPWFEPTGETEDGARTGVVHHQIARSVYDPETEVSFNPETGETIPDELPGTVVESDATFSLIDDMAFYGMLYTTASFSTRYNDKLNVFKLGTAEEITPGDGFEQIRFTDPVTGDSYGAIREQCNEDAGPAGHLSLCSSCSSSTDCAGYTGGFQGVYCWYLSEDATETHCLLDCTEDGSICPAGTTCVRDSQDYGSCIPDSNVCEGPSVASACSPTEPYGACDPGQTCVDGACVRNTTSCKFGLADETAGTAMVTRGQLLSEDFTSTLDAYYSVEAGDPRENELYWRNSKARFDLEWHVQKVNSIRAIYNIFGKVY